MTPVSATILAIDQSTAATKGLLFNHGKQLVDQFSLDHRQYYPQRGRVEHDALEILENVRLVTRELLGRHPGWPPPAALAITNQRETVVAWDRETGRPFGRAIVWQDQRGTSVCEDLLRKGLQGRIREKTGLLVDSYFSASKLATLVREDKGAAAALRAGRLMAGTIDTWLIWNLTDRQVFCTDFSNASRTMLFDIFRLRWDEELLKIFELVGLLLPDVRSSDSSFGESKPANGMPNIPIAAVMGDSHAALFGHCGWHPGDAKATFGTGTSVMLNIGETPRPPAPGVVLSIGWGLRGRPVYVLEGNIHSSGDTMRWLRDNLKMFTSYAEAEALASGIADNGGVYLVPAFAGLGAPYWEHGISALVTGLSRGCGREHIVRAGLESIAYQVRDLVRVMEACSSPLTFLHAGGGATRNRFLMQFQADILGIPVIVPPVEELSALGVSYMASISIGICGDPEDLVREAMAAIQFFPKMESYTRDALIGGWAAAVKQTLAGKTVI